MRLRMIPADRLRSLVKEATPSLELSVEEWRKNRNRLDALAPQLAELVADMAEAIEAEIERMTEAWESHSRANDYARIVQSDAHLNGLKFARDEVLSRLVALFPEDSA